MIVTIIPAYNEEKYILDTIKNTFCYTEKIIVVDDGSTDTTYVLLKTLKHPNLIVLHHRINLGKGAALKTGCEAACKLGATIFIVMDGDGQHLPQDIPHLIAPIRNNTADIVFGIRKIGKGMPLMMRVGNTMLSYFIKHILNVTLQDSQSGFRAFHRQIYSLIVWESNDYFVETEIIARMNHSHLRYREVEIKTIYHDNYKGTTFLDGIKIFFKLIHLKFL